MRAYHFLESRWAEDDLQKQRLKISQFADLGDSELSANLLSKSVHDFGVARNSFYCASLWVRPE